MRNGKGNPLNSKRMHARLAQGAPDIHFYHQHKSPYGCFSNFYAAEIFLDGKKWPTTEHYFQAMKFPSDPALVERVRTTSTPSKAAAFGRDRRFPLRQDWNKEFVGADGRTTNTKLEVMRIALRAKFDQHPLLRQTLLSTRGCKLVERTANDHYWGDGGDGSGKNMLGKLLMGLRDSLLKEGEEKQQQEESRALLQASS
ncbi:hypothetical protein GOP47_0012980 [Adiantum capillus-veneris]|uniref:NADAR domain-containing protein n=1 Tax=Adiantum capillus-veneris TaxID=13818 RepID=A0A9D4URQ0_ADICA|nr:hypothetical protein GOP47_0012980 [Adiantum capillus-veneris]